MPCQTPFRDDTQQMLLFKIASCLSDGDFIAGVASFNGRTGNVTLEAGDITAALGCTPLCESDGDARYVLKSGDSMTGALSIDNGVLVANEPALELSQTWNNAAVTFTGLYENITLTAASANSNLFNFQVNGSDRFNFTSGGTLRAIRQDASDAGVNFILRKRGNAGDANGAVAADSTIGAISYSGWDGTAFATGSHIDGLASEAWTAAAHGSRLDFYVTPVASIVDQLTFRITSAGPNVFSGLAYQYNGVNMLRAQTALSNYFIGPSGNLTMTGSFNTAIGNAAFTANTTGSRNVAFGNSTLASNTVGFRNVAIGDESLFNNTTGDSNLALGYQSLFVNTVGNRNVALGYTALTNTTSSFNVAVGYAALNANTTGAGSVATGYFALLNATTGGQNVASGYFTLINLSTGANNTAIGYSTGLGITTGSGNTILGANVSGLAAALTNNIILADGTGVIRLQIDSSGNTTLAGTVATADGTAALPAHTFSADLDSGLYRVAANNLGISTSGVVRLSINTTDLTMATAFRLAMASGANSRAGNATLVAGTVTVANTSVTANTIVMLTRKTSGGTLGTAITYTVIAATSFTINSDSALDTSTFSYLLIENP